MDQITVRPIGIIYTPYKEIRSIPIQGVFGEDVEARIELKDEYTDGLRDLDGFSHAILIYCFHRSQREEIEGRPFLEQDRHGIFAIRSPHRPNHLGVSVVKIKRIEGNRVHFTEVDMLDGTPLLDIKPYVKYFDGRVDVISGWLDKHFGDGKIPNQVAIR